MKIISSSKNLSKNNAIKSYFENYDSNIQLDSFSITADGVTNPVNDEVLQAVKTRNEALKTLVLNEKADYDYLLSLQTGYFKSEDKYFMGTYALIENKNGEQSFGISSMIEVTKLDYEFFISNLDLKELIEILGKSFINYLSNDSLTRDTINFEAIRNAFINFNNKVER